MCFRQLGWSSRSTAESALFWKRGRPWPSEPLATLNSPSCTAARITLKSCSDLQPARQACSRMRSTSLQQACGSMQHISLL